MISGITKIVYMNECMCYVSKSLPLSLTSCVSLLYVFISAFGFFMIFVFVNLYARIFVFMNIVQYKSYCTCTLFYVKMIILTPVLDVCMEASERTSKRERERDVVHFMLLA